MTSYPKRILHLSDLHLFGDKNTALIGVHPYLSFTKVMEKVAADVQTKKPELIVVSGDISQDYSTESYKIANEFIKSLNCPIATTLGNHDYYPIFKQILLDPHDNKSKITTVGKWKILILDSHWSEHVAGILAPSELDFLAETLAKDTTSPTLIFIHHHILPVGSTWIDKIGVSNAKDFFATIKNNKNIKAVICGHVHQDTAKYHDDTVYLSTPSTCWQFACYSPGFKLDTLMPGYRWLEINKDGTFATGVTRIAYDAQFLPDLTSKGY